MKKEWQRFPPVRPSRVEPVRVCIDEQKRLWWPVRGRTTVTRSPSSAPAGPGPGLRARPFIFLQNNKGRACEPAHLSFCRIISSCFNRPGGAGAFRSAVFFLKKKKKSYYCFIIIIYCNVSCSSYSVGEIACMHQKTEQNYVYYSEIRELNSIKCNCSQNVNCFWSRQTGKKISRYFLSTWKVLARIMSNPCCSCGSTKSGPAGNVV